MKNISVFKSILMFAFMCMTLTFASCNDEEEITSVKYTMGFNACSFTNPSEISFIESTYQKALSVSSNQFTLNGSVSECDAKVKAACSNAEEIIKSKSIKGSFLFVVTNNTTMKEIYSYQIN